MANNFPNLRPTLNLDMVNGIYVDSRVTFTRAGTRTYYGQEVVKAEENLFIRSQEFSNAAWLIDAVTLSTVTAPDGTSTASKMLPTAVSAPHYIYGAASNKPKLASATYTKSVRIKADGYGFATVSIAGTSSAIYVAATFDLSGAGAVTKTGVGGSGGTLVGSSITALADGWYQCTVTGSVTQAAGFDLISVATTGTPTYGNYGLETFTGDGTSAIQIWGAQIEQRSFAAAYTATTTQPITRYQRQLKTAAANEWPREFDPVTGECLGRSVWESRTNRCLRAEEFDNAAWVKTNVTVAANQTIAPDGTLTADQLTASAANGTVIQDLGVVASAAKTGSLYLKRYIGTGTIEITLNGGSTWTAVTLTSTWTRFNLTATLADEDFGIRIVTSGDSIFAWGGMVETGAFQTPYIPTVASQVTRLADSAVMTGVNFSSWFNPSEGTLFVDGAGVGTSSAIVTLAQGATAGNRVFIAVGASGASNNIMLAVAGGSTQVSLLGTPTTSNKVAGSYLVNDYKACLNGGTVGTDTVALVPVVDNLRLGQTVGTIFSGYYRRITYYPQALTSANLQAITR